MGLTFAAAGMAGATSTVMLHPLEVLRSRLTVGMSAPGQRGGLIAATSHMVQQEGLASLYKGLLPSVMAIIPEAAITYGTSGLLAAKLLLSSLWSQDRGQSSPFQGLGFKENKHSHGVKLESKVFQKFA